MKRQLERVAFFVDVYLPFLFYLVMMKIKTLSLLGWMALCTLSCSHPYFELTQPLRDVSSEVSTQADFVIDVEDSSSTYITSFYTNRRNPLEDLQDTIQKRAIEQGANAIVIRELRELSRGGYVIKGELYHSRQPVSPLFDTTHQQVVFIREESDDYSCILRMGDTLEVNIPKWSYVILSFDSSVKEIDFSINRVSQTLGLDGRDKMIGIQSGLGGSASNNGVSVAPVYSSRGMGIGVFFPLSTSSRFINHVSMYAEFNPMVMIARMSQCQKVTIVKN